MRIKLNLLMNCRLILISLILLSSIACQSQKKYDNKIENRSILDITMILEKPLALGEQRKKLIEVDNYLKAYISRYYKIDESKINLEWFQDREASIAITVRYDWASTGAVPKRPNPPPPPIQPPIETRAVINNLALKQIRVIGN